MSSFEQSLEKLAQSVAERAALSATPFQETLEALKNLTAYYAVLLKSKKGASSDDEDGGTFADFSAQVVEIPNGRGKTRVRSHRE